METRRERPGAAARIGFGSYQTAWTMLHRFRRAMAPGRDKLTVPVHHGSQESRHPAGRKAAKVLMVMAVEIVEPWGLGASGYAALTETPPPT